jgi:putative flippase GtrA
VKLTQTLRARTATGEFVRFALIGVANTGLTYLVFALLSVFIHYTISYTVAYVFGIFFSYFLNTHFAFGKKPSLKRMFAYPLVYIVQYVVGVVLLQLLVEYFKLDRLIASPIVILATLPLSFILSRFVITAKLR